MFFIWIILKLGSVSLFVLSDLQYSKIGDVVEGKSYLSVRPSLVPWHASPVFWYRSSLSLVVMKIQFCKEILKLEELKIKKFWLEYSFKTSTKPSLHFL